jgi:hypothetical protein
MIDSLDQQILEIIEKAQSIVRSITEREIERGVLFPSVSTMDIKRNLSFDVSVEVIEGRLKSLERDGYIYFERKRWWLTNNGRIVLGRSDENMVIPTPSSKPMRKILEETFSRFEASTRDSMMPSRHPPDFTELVDRRNNVGALLSELKQALATDLISQDEYTKMAERITTKLKDLDVQIEKHVKNRRSSLLREITDLKESLAKKKEELDRLNQVPSRQ